MLSTSKVLRLVLPAAVLYTALLIESHAQTQAPASAPPPLTEEQGLALAKSRACLGCHQVDRKRVGPSFRAIAERHADKDGALTYIVQVIQKGGRGQWGAVPMPGQPVKDQDAQQLAQWIISLRKTP